MKSTRNLRLRLRLIEGALALLLAVFTTAAVSTHQLLLDATNQPTSDVSLSSPHIVGTLDAARLPANAAVITREGNLLINGTNGSLFANYVFFRQLCTESSLQIADGDGNLFAAGNLSVSGATSLDSGFVNTDGAGDLNAGASLCVGGNLIADNSGGLYAAGILIGDPAGFLCTGSQTYQEGSAAPTGFLLIKDGTGTVYRVPASAVAP